MYRCYHVTKWPDHTVLITGDDVIDDVTPVTTRWSSPHPPSSTRYQVEVRPYPGACIDDMYDYLKPLLRRRPSHVILHVGFHDTSNVNKTSVDILTEIINLKTFIETVVVGITVFVSCPVVRCDDEVADLKIVYIRDMMEGLLGGG